MGELVSIVYKPGDAAAVDGAYTRVPLQQATLVAGHGIDGDSKGGGSTRHLNIMSVESMRTLRDDGFLAAPGQLGEQLIVSGLIVDDLPAGAILAFGEAARVEVVEPRRGCSKFEAYQGKLKEDANGRLGVLARVLVGGEIAVGDAVEAI